jgi:hypothetical protein
VLGLLVSEDAHDTKHVLSLTVPAVMGVMHSLVAL